MHRRLAQPCYASHHRGYTLLEVLVAIAIVGALVSTFLPHVAGARRKAANAATLSYLRAHGVVFAAYNLDHREAYPNYIDPRAGVGTISVPSRDISYTTRYFWASALWNYAMADEYYDSNPFHESFYPYDYPHGFRSPELRWGATPFIYSCSFWAADPYWNPSTRIGPSQWQQRYASGVVFPSAKITLVSDYVLPRPVTPEPGPPANPPAHAPRDVMLCDGAVRSLPVTSFFDGMASGDGVWAAPIHQGSGSPGQHTIDGLRGRDLR